MEAQGDDAKYVSTGDTHCRYGSEPVIRQWKADKMSSQCTRCRTLTKSNVDTTSQSGGVEWAGVRLRDDEPLCGSVS